MRKGFSLVEMLVTVALLILIMVLGFFFLFQRRSYTDLTDTEQQIAALLREAQSRAVSGSASSAWGVHFSNGSTPFYALFAGSSYASSSATMGQYPLPPEVCFGNIPSGGTEDVDFSQATGTTSGAIISLQGNTSLCGGSSVISVATTTPVPAGYNPLFIGGAVYSGKLYLHTSSSSDPNGYTTTTVIYASVNADGTLGSWNVGTNVDIPSGSEWYGNDGCAAASCVVPNVLAANGYLYLLNLLNSGGDYGAIRYAPLNASGSVGAFNTIGYVDPPGVQNVFAIYNGYAYANKAYGGSGNLMYYAAINSSGTLGAWHAANSPSANFVESGNGDMIAYSSYLYLVDTQGDTFYAPINSTGSIGVWNTGPPLASADFVDGGIGVNNGYLFVLDTKDSILAYAQINGDGSLSLWNELSLPTTLTFDSNNDIYGSAMFYNGYMYLFDNSSTAVYYTSLAGIPNAYQTSKVINISTDGSVTAN